MRNQPAGSRCSRYPVYQSDGVRILPIEFAFGVGNLRPVELSPWYALRDDDVEARHTVGMARADEFRAAFDARLDALLAELGCCARDSGGTVETRPSRQLPGEEPFSAWWTDMTPTRTH